MWLTSFIYARASNLEMSSDIRIGIRMESDERQLNTTFAKVQWQTETIVMKLVAFVAQDDISIFWLPRHGMEPSSRPTKPFI